MQRLKPLFLVLLGLICTAIFYSILSYFEHPTPPLSPIRWIVQTGPLKEGLKTDYLAEVLTLSSDHPKAMRAEEAEEALLRNPLIKKASVSLLNPETLYIDYTLRQPMFYLGNLQNIAVDKEGCLFPLSPFFTPKRLPKLYLEEESLELSWNAVIEGKGFKLALELMQLIGDSYRVLSIDVSQGLQNTLGEREVVLLLDNENSERHYLRLTPKNFHQELLHYAKIRERLLNESFVVDLRVPQLAFLNQLTEG